MEKALSLEFLRVVESAAIASARTMGLGDGHKSDHAAVETLRTAMDTVGMDGTIVIGEGERDQAPMLYIGEKVGAAVRDNSRKYPEVDIAVRSAGGNKSLRDRRTKCHRGAGSKRPRRIAPCPRSLHGQNYRGAILQRRSRTGCTCRAQSAGHCEAPRPQG
jgi:Bacterial fructose-1,6-bisphosphatase, glpX-encoded